ncbi:MAG: ABC transporter substrate-binding protein [Actinomycetota bacterium]|nr:ABC transporter substrate-binding protein [Actinomycetota bacterium]
MINRSKALTALTVTTVLLLTVACGGDDSGDTSTDTEQDGGDTRTVEGAYGPIEIPAEPQRIFADLMTVDYLTALGYDTDKIVGVFDAEYFKASDDHYLAEFFASQELVDPGYQRNANLEAIAAADPDLILMPFDQIDGAEVQDELGKIAPLLVVPTSETRDPGTRYGGTASFQDWRSTLRAYGEVLELDDEAEAYIAETDQQLAALQAEHGELISSITATEAKVGPDFMAINALNTALDSGVLGTILMSELGFQSPPEQAAAIVDDYGTVELSNENIALLDGDILFLEVREDSKLHEQSPLWPTLRVVQEDHVFVVGNHWEYGGAVAARDVIADIDAALDELAAG